MKSRSSWPSKGHRIKASKHTGIYDTGKNIEPMPKCAYIQMRLSLPMEYAMALQEMYPNETLYGAVKQFLLDNIKPISQETK